jgi:predicted O-linked N-acetylglucosamine transferase (SPINDLY family)
MDSTGLPPAKDRRMNARIEALMIQKNSNDDGGEPEPDLIAWVKSGKMSLAQAVEHADALQGQGHAKAASNLYGLWLAHTDDPRKHLVFFNLGSLLQNQEDLAGAQAAYERCLALSPGFAQAAINLGLVHEKQGQVAHAIRVWAGVAAQRYLDTQASAEMTTMALNHIGRLQEIQRNYTQALEALEHSLQVNPKQAGVIQHWVHIRQKACEWPVYKPLPGISQNEMLMATSPLAMLALTDDPLMQLLSAHAFVARTYGLKEEWLCRVKRYHHGKTRVGFVSGDLREHAVGFLLPSVFESIDRDRYEVYGYDFTVDDGSAHRQRLLSMFDHVRPVHSLSDRQAAECVLQDEIDVLIDLHGLSAGARPGIFALHPAPKQGTYLGFIGTTGMPWFDFVITDRNAFPPELAEFFMEKPMYVEGSFIPMTPPDTDLPAVTRADVGLPEDAFVMGAFGNVYKITPEMFTCWMRLLERIPKAVLWLIDDNATTTQNLKNHARVAQADLSRIVFSPRTPHSEFCARLKLCDVYLDTYPYNCGSTTNDVIRAGVPLVSRYGKTMVSRMGRSVLSAIGHAELAVSTVDGYEARIMKMALEPTRFENKIKKFPGLFDGQENRRNIQ